MAIQAEVHPNCICRILDSGEWVFGPKDPTDKGNPSPCERCKRLGDAHNRRLGFSKFTKDELIKFTLNEIKLLKLNDDGCSNC